jgi:hypothetical protein
MRLFLLLELFLELGVGLLKITDVVLEQPCFSCLLLLQLFELFAKINDSFGFLPRCVDPSLGAPGGHS